MVFEYANYLKNDRIRIPLEDSILLTRTCDVGGTAIRTGEDSLERLTSGRDHNSVGSYGIIAGRECRISG